MEMHVAVEPGWTWDTGNGAFLSEAVYLPPELVPEPGAGLGAGAALAVLAGLARRRREWRRRPASADRPGAPSADCPLGPTRVR